MAHAGYLNRVILLAFPELAEGCTVLIRNPRLMAPHELDSPGTAVEGETAGSEAEQDSDSMHRTIAKLIVGWRNVYPADLDTAELDLDGDTDLEALAESLNSADQEPLGQVNETNIRRVPFVIINKIAEQMGDLANPQ